MPTTQIDSPVWLDSPPIRKPESELPEWYLEFQKASWERFQNLPIPSRKDQNWRYADLKKSRFEKLYPIGSPNIPYSITERADQERFHKAAAHFVFVNGELVDSDTTKLPSTTICVPIEEAISAHGDFVREYFDADATRLGDEKYAALNGAASIHGIFVKVTDGEAIDGPIIIQHFISGESAPVFPRTLVIAENNSEVSVIESHHSIDDETPGLSIGICDLHADSGGKVQHVHIQNLNTSSKQVHLGTSNSGKDSRVQSAILNLGGAWIRNESINRMTDQGADTHVYGANLANNHQEFDQRTLQIHDAQHTTSDLLIKNALYDKSRVIFGGLIQVLPGAHHTDSYQSCRNLIGSEEAEINAMPGLEIDADQVRCSHGATSGQISEDEIFYLRTRGIPPEEARRIVSFGFLNEALKKIDGKELGEWLGMMVEEKFLQTLT